MANRVSIRAPMTIRAVFDSNAGNTITLLEAAEVIDFWVVGPATAIGGFTTELRNGATNVISTVITPNTNAALTRGTLVRTYTNVAAGTVLTFQDAAGDPTGAVAYVTILPGVTATS